MPRSAPRTKIAAVGTLAALGALAAVATASNPAGRQHAPAPAPVAAVRAAAPPKTIVVHRTVGVLTKFVPARTSKTPSHRRAATKHKAAAAATPAAVTPTAAPKAAPKPRAQPTTRSAGDDAADLPEPGVTEDECLPVTVGGVPQDTTTGTPTGGRPLRTSHPLPEDVPGVVDGCGLAPAPGQSDATTSSTAAPAAGGSTVVVP